MVDTYRKDVGKFNSIPIMKYVLSDDIDSIKKMIVADSSIVNFVHKKSGDSPLLLAARYKRFEILKLLIEFGADKEHKNIDGKRSLHEAAGAGCVLCVHYLLEQCVNVDALKRADWTPSMIATTKGHLNVIEELVRFGANVTLVNKDGWNCFHLACREGFVDAIKLYLDMHNESLWNTCSKNLRTPLHTACMHGQYETVKFLLQHCHYENDQKDSCGTTPLMDTLRFGHVSISHYLVTEHHCNIFECDNLGRFPIHIAAHSGEITSLRYLIEKCKVNVNSTCLNSTTIALHLAAKEGHLDAVRYIISVGGSVNAVDKNKRTALHLATAANKVEIVTLLLSDYDADPGIIDICEKSALEYALTDEMKQCFVIALEI